MSNPKDLTRLKSPLPHRGLLLATESSVKPPMSDGCAQPHTADEISPVTPVRMKFFEKFPLEVRQEIWFLSASKPRVIEITGYLGKVNPETKIREVRMSCNALVPAIMHACVDSRRAGMKMYKPLTLNKFTGTYVNWSNDYIMFKKSRKGQKSIEDIYMTYEGALPANVPNFELVLNLERLAVSPSNLNNFIRVRSDLEGKIEAACPGFVLVYPKLKEIVVAEAWREWEAETQNLSIRPKRVMSPSLPNYFCPASPVVFSPGGVRVVRNRWHQDCSWMRLVPGKGKLLHPVKKPKDVAVYPAPKVPERLPGISRFSAVKLRQLCRDRNIEEAGSRRDMIARLHACEFASYPLAHTKYKEDLHKWAGIMLGHAEAAEGTEYGLDVKKARAEAVVEFLTKRGFAENLIN